MTYDNRRGSNSGGRKPIQGRRWFDLRGQESVEKLSGPVITKKIDEVQQTEPERVIGS